MADLPKFSFSKVSPISKGALVILCPQDGDPTAIAGTVAADIDLGAAAKAAKFTGKSKQAFEVLAPAGTDLERIVVVGTGKAEEMNEIAWRKLGGATRARVATAEKVTVLLAGDALAADAASAATFAQGWQLRAYEFDRYKTRKKDDEKSTKQAVTMLVEDVSAAKKAWAVAEAVSDGVMLARDLVNEPANILGPVEFAERAAKLADLGVEIDVLDGERMEKHGMGALLGVAQGSVRPPRMVVMKWMGGKAKQKPVAFVGKGVVFDTGGISIKPAGGMEDMKGDMGGAAAVTGLMHALAARKAKVNAIGIIGLVENMPDGNAQRPGDIVTSMSGQTIEIINTDAEGRLVLADALWYCKEIFKPQFMINLATLTGAILVALGNQHAGIFSNNDDLAEKLTKAGIDADERVWRLPLGPEYDKMIDSKFADMKNTGGRYAGSITAAQFLQRYVDDTPWVHIDVAGTAMSSPSNDINTSWGSGYGVRLLDQLVRDNYEG